MVTQIRESTRTARKPYRCALCAGVIRVGVRHHVQTNIFDGRVYDWRECLPCDRDGVLHFVDAWTGGYYDEGVGYDDASEWADESVQWSKSGAERRVARAWLARAAGGEGE